MVPARALRNVSVQLRVLSAGVPAASAWKADLGGSPVGVMAVGPSTSSESSVSCLWYSDQFSFVMAASGPGASPARNLVSVRMPRKRMIWVFE